MENVYERIHKNAKRVLEEVGFRIKNIEVKKILENTGIAAYDETTGHIHILQDYTQHCVDIAPKSFKCDPGFNSFGLGGCIPFIEEEPGKFRPVTHKDLERAAKFISKNQ